MRNFAFKIKKFTRNLTKICMKIYILIFVILVKFFAFKFLNLMQNLRENLTFKLVKFRLNFARNFTNFYAINLNKLKADFKKIYPLNLSNFNAPNFPQKSENVLV